MFTSPPIRITGPHDQYLLSRFLAAKLNFSIHSICYNMINGSSLCLQVIPTAKSLYHLYPSDVRYCYDCYTSIWVAMTVLPCHVLVVFLPVILACNKVSVPILIWLDIKHEVPNRHSALDVDDNDIHLHLPFVKLLLDSLLEVVGEDVCWGGQIESEWKAKVMETCDLCFALASLFRIMGAKNDSNTDRHCLFQVRHTWKYGCLYLLISCGTIIHRFYRQPTDREKDEQQTKMTKKRLFRCLSVCTS